MRRNIVCRKSVEYDYGKNEKSPAISMVLPDFGKNNAPLYAVLRFYTDCSPDEEQNSQPYVLLTVSDRPSVNGW